MGQVRAGQAGAGSTRGVGRRNSPTSEEWVGRGVDCPMAWRRHGRGSWAFLSSILGEALEGQAMWYLREAAPTEGSREAL